MSLVFNAIFKACSKLKCIYIYICKLAVHHRNCSKRNQAVGGEDRHDMPPPLSCPRGRRSASRGQADGNVAAVSQGPPLQLPDAPTRRWVKRSGDLDLWPFDLETGVRVTCDVGCANFGLPRPLCSRLRPDIRDRQTYRHQTKASLNAPAY